MIASAANRPLIDRMLGAALLEAETYEEAALTPAVRTHAALIVIIGAVAAGLGGIGAGLTGLLLGILAALVGWGLYAFIAYRVATARFRVPRTHANWSATLRVLGLASSPRVFLVLTFVPEIGFLVGLAVHVWVLITTVFALRLALDMGVRPAIAAGAVGCLPLVSLWALTAVLV